MSINFGYQIKFKLKHVRRIKQLLNRVISEEQHKLDQLSIVFTTDDFLLDLNSTYLNHDYFTDIITFDYNNSHTSNKINGELYISYDRALENANSFNVDSEIELLRLMIHGILHLCGYIDSSTKDKKRMTQKENYYLSFF